MRQLKAVALGICVVAAVLLSICSIGNACQVAWDVNQPTEVDAAPVTGYFSFDLETTFEADYNTTHTVYFGVAYPDGNNLVNTDVDPDIFNGLSDTNGIGGSSWHLLETINDGNLDELDDDGLFRTSAYAHPGFCSGEHQCMVNKP